MRSPRITALILVASLTLVTIGYNVGTQLTASVESYMERTTARAVRMMEE